MCQRLSSQIPPIVDCFVKHFCPLADFSFMETSACMAEAKTRSVRVTVIFWHIQNIILVMHASIHIISSQPCDAAVCIHTYSNLCSCQFVKLHAATQTAATDLYFCPVLTGAQCTADLPTKKVKASHPHNRVTFSSMPLWSQAQTIKTKVGKR